MITLLARLLATPIVIPLGVPVDLEGNGRPEAVLLELDDLREGCARTGTLRVGERRLSLTGGLWIGSAPPTADLLQIEVVDLTPKSPDRHLLVRGFPLCDQDYTSWFDLTYGQHTAWLVGVEGPVLATLWAETTHDRRWKVRPDGSWEVTEYTCTRPAKRRGAWDEASSQVLVWGEERRVTRRHRWTAAGLESRVVRTRVVRSGCGGRRG